MTAATENDSPNTVETETTPAVNMTEATKPAEKEVEKKEGVKELEAISTDGVTVEPGLGGRIVKQLEYYFGDRNLPQDRFMLREVTLDNGWISLDTMLNFKRLASICNEKVKIAKALEDSNSGLVVLNEQKNKIRRNPDKPLPKNTEELKLANNLKTVYVKGLPLDMNIDRAEEFFSDHGKASYIKLRKDAEGKFKGSVFIEFVEQSDADKIVLANKELKFSEDTDPLIIMSRNDYFKSKNQNVKNVKNLKRESQMGGTELKHEVPEHVEYQKGLVLKLEGLEGIDTSREDMKQLFEGHSVNWVNFNKGDVEAYIRFEGSAQDALDKVKVDEKFILSGKEAKAAILEGEEEEAYWKKAAHEKAEFFNKKNRKRKFDGGRGGGRGRGKRYRRD